MKIFIYHETYILTFFNLLVYNSLETSYVILSERRIERRDYFDFLF